jgi:hypothetical protein
MTQYTVFDHENTQAFGPYDSKEEAEADIIEKAIENEWVDVLEVATHEGWLEDGSTDTGEGETLVLVELQGKQAK